MMRQAAVASNVHIEPIVAQSDADHVQASRFSIWVIALKIIITLQLLRGRVSSRDGLCKQAESLSVFLILSARGS
jgi:hypothetical protein